MRDLETNASYRQALLRWSSGQQFRSVCLDGCERDTQRVVSSMVSRAVSLIGRSAPFLVIDAPFGAPTQSQS